MNFGFTQETKEFATGSAFPVGIHANTIITNATYNEEHDSLDITFENPVNGYTKTERIFNPIKDGREIPEWTSIEKEIGKTQGKVKHILKRFLSEEETLFEANSFKQMAEVVSELLQDAITNKTKFSLKLVFDKNLQYTELAKGRFMATDNEEPLAFTKWERENRMIVDEPVNTGESDDTIF
jgi:hypothetical protein